MRLGAKQPTDALFKNSRNSGTFEPNESAKKGQKATLSSANFIICINSDSNFPK